MKTAELRHRITIQRRSTTRDQYGGITESYATHATLWAKAVPLRGDEQVEAQAVYAGKHVDFTVRYSGQGGTVRTEDRILWDDELYNIVYISNRLGNGQWAVIRGVTGLSEPNETP